MAEGDQGSSLLMQGGLNICAGASGTWPRLTAEDKCGSVVSDCCIMAPTELLLYCMARCCAGDGHFCGMQQSMAHHLLI